LIPGRRFGPQAAQGTPLAALLPVEFEPAEKSQSNDEPLRIDLTAPGRESAMLRLSDRPSENLEIWKNLPPIYWIAPAARGKPGATVLAAVAKTPLIALQPFGLGQVL